MSKFQIPIGSKITISARKEIGITIGMSTILMKPFHLSLFIRCGPSYYLSAENMFLCKNLSKVYSKPILPT